MLTAAKREEIMRALAGLGVQDLQEVNRLVCQVGRDADAALRFGFWPGQAVEFVSRTGERMRGVVDKIMDRNVAVMANEMAAWDDQGQFKPVAPVRCRVSPSLLRVV